jgi:YegS/Rv2252/BmrU family lipid kinase
VASGDYSFLHPAIAKQNITDIVIAGGDGTINRVVNTFAGGDLRFGIIPCGSGNGLAFSAGIPKNVTKSLQIIFKGEVQWTDAFTINEQFACMLCGIGFDAQVAHDFANAPKRGLLTYVRKTVSNFISSPFYPLILHTKGKEIKTKAFFLSIANSNQFGNHFTIAPKASLTDGLLDIVIMTRQNRLTMLFNTVKQISGQNKLNSVEMINDNASLIYFQTNYLRINNPGLAPVHIDGDPVETMKEIEVKVIRNAFQLIYP